MQRPRPLVPCGSSTWAARNGSALYLQPKPVFGFKKLKFYLITAKRATT
jgi:hypothetical protein